MKKPILLLIESVFCAISFSQISLVHVIQPFLLNSIADTLKVVNDKRDSTPENNTILQVGFFAMDLNPDIGIPLAGYGSKMRRLKPVDLKNKYQYSFFFKPSVGIHTPIRSKVMTLDDSGKKLIFISIDVIGIERRFVRDLAGRLSSYGIKESDLIVSATHTHSGPGVLSRNLLLDLFAVDFFKRSVYDNILSEVTACVETADLYTSSFLAEGLQRNKFRNFDKNWYNSRASLLLAKARNSGQWLGGIVNFSVHGGGMPIDTLVYSSDFPGQIEIQMEDKICNMNSEKKQPVILFINGAEGDVATPKRGVKYIEELACEFAKQSDNALADYSLQAINSHFTVIRKKLWLGVPSSPLKYCSADNSILKKAPVPLRVGLFPLMPLKSFISIVEVGGITFLTWPGEPSTELGFELQNIARNNGFPNSWILGLTNDYTSYYTTHDEYLQGTYDACSSLYNFRGGKRILKKYQKLFERNSQNIRTHTW
jgi:hypothetical protein